jgi:hypothetical protein
MWVRIDSGSAVQITSFAAYSSTWLWNGNIPNDWESHDYYFSAKDTAGNLSGEDHINVDRSPP